MLWFKLLLLLHISHYGHGLRFDGCGFNPPLVKIVDPKVPQGK
jgi:hypothetical protein